MVEPIHRKAMPVIPQTDEEHDVRCALHGPRPRRYSGPYRTTLGDKGSPGDRVRVITRNGHDWAKRLPFGANVATAKAVASAARQNTKSAADRLGRAEKRRRRSAA